MKGGGKSLLGGSGGGRNINGGVLLIGASCNSFRLVSTDFLQ